MNLLSKNSFCKYYFSFLTLAQKPRISYYRYLVKEVLKHFKFYYQSYLPIFLSLILKELSHQDAFHPRHSFSFEEKPHKRSHKNLLTLKTKYLSLTVFKEPPNVQETYLKKTW